MGERSSALAHVRVCDLSGQLAGAGATRLLAAFGAQVIRIEDPVTHGLWDIVCQLPPRIGDDRTPEGGSGFNNHNVEKLGVTIDLRTDGGKDLLRRLVRVSDAVTENFAAGVMDRLGFGTRPSARSGPTSCTSPTAASARRVRTARTSRGGRSRRPCAGLTWSSGLPDRRAGRVGLLVHGSHRRLRDGDSAAGRAVAPQRTGEGQWVDVACVDAGHGLNGPTVPRRDGERAASSASPASRWSNRNAAPAMAPHGIYPCDGTDAWVAVACRHDDDWRALAGVVAEPWADGRLTLPRSHSDPGRPRRPPRRVDAASPPRRDRRRPPGRRRAGRTRGPAGRSDATTTPTTPHGGCGPRSRTPATAPSASTVSPCTCRRATGRSAGAVPCWARTTTGCSRRGARADRGRGRRAPQGRDRVDGRPARRPGRDRAGERPDGVGRQGAGRPRRRRRRRRTARRQPAARRTGLGWTTRPGPSGASGGGTTTPASGRSSSTSTRRPTGSASSPWSPRPTSFSRASRSGGSEERGIGYDRLREANRSLVQASITPYGRDTPSRHLPATDLTSLAGGGPVWSCGYDDHSLPPVRGGGNQAFHIASHWAVQAVLVALFDREATGEGQFVDVSMHAACNVTTEMASYGWLAAGAEVQRQTGRHAAPKLSMATQVRCADGRYVNIGFTPGTADQIRAVARLARRARPAGRAPGGLLARPRDRARRRALLRARPGPRGHRDLRRDPRRRWSSSPATCRPASSSWARRSGACRPAWWPRSRRCWRIRTSSPRGFPVTVPHELLGRDVVHPGAPFVMSASPWRISRRAPLLGEHDREVLDGPGGACA